MSRNARLIVDKVSDTICDATIKGDCELVEMPDGTEAAEEFEEMVESIGAIRALNWARRNGWKVTEI